MGWLMAEAKHGKTKVRTCALGELKDADEVDSPSLFQVEGCRYPTESFAVNVACSRVLCAEPFAQGDISECTELDREIERAYGADIGELLALAGQPAFRRYEHRCLDHQLAENDGVVIASGGGIVANTEAFNRLLERTHVIWLKATPDEHMDRVMAQGDLRPMENSREAMSDLRGILEAREPLYARAHAIVDTSGAKVAESAAKLTATARALISRDDQASRIATPETLQNRATG